MGTTSTSVVYYTVKVQIPENISGNFLPSMTARAQSLVKILKIHW